MPYIGIGCAFLVDCGPKPDQKHLHVLITHRCADGTYLAVCVETVYPGEYFDSSCVFQGGEHPFIQHASWVPYKHSFILSDTELQQKFADFEYIIKQTANSSVVTKMGDGLLKSPRATKKIKAYYEANKEGVALTIPDGTIPPPDTENNA